MQNQKVFYGVIAISLLLIGGVLGYLIPGYPSFDSGKFTPSPWEGSVIAMSTGSKINHGNVFVNIFNNYHGSIYVVDIVNEAGEAAKIAAIANRDKSYTRKGTFADDWVMFRVDSEGQFMTQTMIPSEGQIDVFFNSEDSSELTIRYFLRVGDDEARLVTETHELRDDGFYIKKVPQ